MANMYNNLQDNELRCRIQSLLDNLNLNPTQFSETINVTQQTFNRQINGTGAISIDVVYAILCKYTQVSAEWLLRGEGEMYRADADTHKRAPAVSDEQSEEVPSKEVLLVPAGARGGSLEHFEAQVGMNPYNAEVIRSPFINADFAYTIKDDSMSPDYPAGTVLFVKRLVTSIIKWGNSYLFDTDDGFQFVKLRRSELGDDYVHCVPLNAEDYEPYDVPKSDIHGIYKVLGAMRW